MISVLIPIYNGIEFIEASVNSIKSQTFQEWELIIGVNGHPKNSDVYRKAKQYEDDKIKTFDLFNIRGKSEALNEMLKYCSYAWIALLDVDDEWLPRKLEAQIPYTDRYDVIGTMCKYFGDSHAVPSIPLGDISMFDFLKVNPIINSSSLIRKKLCNWDSNGIEDYDLWLRLWKQQKKFFNVPEILVLHRIHKQSAFNTKGHHSLVQSLIEKHKGSS